jgi:hypothetical protein
VTGFSRTGWLVITLAAPNRCRTIQNRRARKMNYRKTLIILNSLLILLGSCGRSKDNIQVVQSLNEAKLLAAEKGTGIVVDFWRDG